jgi:dTDP-4-amino-4,6-dideoxygalactose transaminase
VAEVKKMLTKRTKAIIVPHIFGAPAELDLMSFNIPIIEDCAHSLDSEYKKQRVRSFGSVSICSFYATKVITTGEGDMVCARALETEKPAIRLYIKILFKIFNYII